MTTIRALSDSHLLQIFKTLPPYDRLRVSEVCRRWHAASDDPWRDVTHLELIAIPSASIGAIVRKCPNLTSLFCRRRKIILDDVRDTALASFKCLELHGCAFVSHDKFANKTALPLFRAEHGRSSLEELILHKHKFGTQRRRSKRYLRRLLPASLKRLQLSGFDLWYREHLAVGSYFGRMATLHNMECLVLQFTFHNPSNMFIRGVYDDNHLLAKTLPLLTNLRELLFSALYRTSYPRIDSFLCDAMDLPKLEVLILPGYFEEAHCLQNLVLRHPTLRLLVIPGALPSSDVQEIIQVPLRRKFPNGLDKPPLQLLHVFVGERAAALLQFDESPDNWLRVHPITDPFSLYLEKQDITDLFEGSWLARREADQRGREARGKALEVRRRTGCKRMTCIAFDWRYFLRN